MDGRFIAMEVGQLEENVRKKIAKCSGDGTFLYIYIVIVHVCIAPKAFSSFMASVSKIIALILDRTWVRARSRCTSFPH